MNILQQPQNIEAEEAVIGSAIIDPDIISTLSISPAEFFHIRHGYIWQAITDLQAASASIDLLTVAAELERNGKLDEIGGPAYLTRLVTLTPTAYHAPQYAALVSETATRRRLLQAASHIAKLAYQSDAPIAEVVSDAEAAITDVTVSGYSGGIETAREISSRIIDRLIDPDSFAAHIRPLGLRSVDVALGGGLEPELVTVIMSRPGMGKTAVLCQIADTVSERGEIVLFLSKEMSSDQIITRMAARRARVNMLMLKQGRVSDETRRRMIDETAKLSERQTLFIDASASQMTTEAAAIAHRLARRHGRVDWIIADHLRLFSDRADNETHRLGNISWAFKQLAKRLKTRVIVAAQLSRGVEGQADKRPDLKDLRDSGMIEENADNVIGLYRDKYYDPRSAEGNKIEFLFAKARDGERGARPAMAFLEQFGSFEILARDE